jgi:hypothetical protein
VGLAALQTHLVPLMHLIRLHLHVEAVAGGMQVPIRNVSSQRYVWPAGHLSFLQLYGLQKGLLLVVSQLQLVPLLQVRLHLHVVVAFGGVMQRGVPVLAQPQTCEE